MGWKLWEVGCACCSGCQVNFQAFTCPQYYNSWSGFYPLTVVPQPSSISVYLAKCTGGWYSEDGVSCPICFSYGPAITEIFYPLSDLNATGIHTFKYQKGQADALIVNYESGIFFPDGQTVFPLYDEEYCEPECNIDINMALKPLANYMIQGPCAYPLLLNGATYSATYSRLYEQALLAEYDGVFPYASCCADFACCGLPVYCGNYSYCQTPSSCFCYYNGIPGNNYYKVFYNPETITFKINDNFPVLNTPYYYQSNIQLAYAYVTYYPAFTYIPGCLQNFLGFNPDLCQPCLSGGGILGGTYFATNIAFATWSYIGLIYESAPTLSCFPPDISINGAQVPDINQPQNFDCGQVSGFCCGAGGGYAPYPPCNDCVIQLGWCGENAFSDAEQFVQNLPQNIQPGQYGSYIFTGFGMNFCYSGDPSYCPNGLPLIINCPQMIYSMYNQATSCNDTIIFSGYDTFTITVE